MPCSCEENKTLSFPCHKTTKIIKKDSDIDEIYIENKIYYDSRRKLYVPLLSASTIRNRKCCSQSDGWMCNCSDNKIIGEGYHQQFGQAHAEVNAIASVEDKMHLPTPPFMSTSNLVRITGKRLLVLISLSNTVFQKLLFAIQTQIQK